MSRRRAAFAAALLLLPLLAFAFFACGGPEFTAAPTGQDGGGADVTSSTDGGTDSSVVDSSTGDIRVPPVDASIARLVYVSATTGSDTNSGLSQAAPKKTLVSAIAAAAAIDGGAEVHACAGTYAETNLVLGAAVSLRGAYSCATWTRTATFGYPTFDQTNLTIVQNGDPTSQATTLIVSGAVPATSTIDGLVIEGAAALAATSYGLSIKGSASPLVTDDIVTGGAGHTDGGGNGSLALNISGGASPEVKHCAIDGGTGTGGVGSTGVQINSTGTPYVHDNVISGGLGTTTNIVATRGMTIESSAALPNAIANNIVSACDPTGVTGSTTGIRIAASDAAAPIAVDIVGSQVSGCLGDAGQAIGIQVQSPGATVQLLGDRIYGGARVGTVGYTSGVIIESAGTLHLYNSMLHGGDVTGVASVATGLNLGGVTGAAIVDDTIYGGSVDSTPILLAATQSSAQITDVILVGAGLSNAHPAIFGQVCGGALSTLDHTVFANFGGSLYSCDEGDGGTSPPVTTIVGLEALLSPSVAAADLVYASQTACGDDAGCVVTNACPGPTAGCLGSLFGSSWTYDDGVSGLFQSTADGGAVVVGGWVLSANVPCAIARGGIPVAGIATDLYGGTRNAATPTPGAAETATCTP